MKQMYFFLTALLCLFMSTVTYAADKPIPVEQLPAQAKAFVRTNFQGKKMVYAEKDRNSYIPPAIAKYVTANFPAAKITKIEKERFGYEIELSNDVDLKFNSKGALIGMDD